MNEAPIFFLYIIAGSAGITGILQVVLLAHYGNTGNRRLFRAMCLFMLCTAAIDFLYLGYDYYRLRFGVYKSAAFFRVLDIELFILQPALWMTYVRARCSLPGQKEQQMRRVSSFFLIISALAGLISYGPLMKGYYESANESVSTLNILIEAFIDTSLIILLLWHLSTARHRLIQKKSRILVTTITLACVLNEMMNGIVSISILENQNWQILERELDLTPVCLLTISIAAVILLYTEDFSALFRSLKTMPSESGPETVLPGEAASADSSQPELSTSDRLDLIAEKHLLTVREREVLGYCYRGMTNPEIADAMYISMNTVKRHMHNIFEKLDVSSRIELIHLVNSFSPDSAH